MGRVFRRTVVKALGAAAATATPTKATEKPRPATTAPARAFSVSVRDLKLARGADRPLPTTVWFPSAAGKFPLILFSHGFTARPSDYAGLIAAWARAGFVVAAPA